ncbi:MAG: hypothetical protein M1834_002984 [Cirrosporium novae-zelandiae]|nr:MAG: hypothetical protein M1834_002984 [Cirrosporium novae-zelandiae]
MATTKFIPNLISGALFGAALTASGVFAPPIILSQFRLQNFHMLQVFLGASASSALIIALLNRLHLSNTTPRSPSPLYRFGTVYDGNMIGGLMIGLGMVLAGACPGTVFAQVGAGIRSGYFALAGALVGGIIYAKMGPDLKGQPPPTTTSTTPKPDKQLPALQKRTLHALLHLPPTLALLTFCTLSTLAIALTSKLTPSSLTNPSPKPFLPPTYSGLLIGASQALSMLISGNTLGTSGSFEQFGAWFWFLLSSPERRIPSKRPATRAMTFCLGMIGGTFLTSKIFPSTLDILLSGVGAGGEEISELGAFMGGLVMAFGARVAGGCTSGHGITGMAMGSISSFVSVGAMFGAGIGIGGVLLG